MRPEYPTVEHERAADAIVTFFSACAGAEAVILAGSTARGKASRDSCLDVVVLVRPDASAAERDALQRQWDAFHAAEPVFKALLRVGKYSQVNLDFSDGCFEPRPRDWTSGPDSFELEIGNTLVYAAPLWERGDYFRQLRARWLPYYDEALRRERLADARRYCLNNLDHIPLYVDRGLYFQSFRRLYDAYREFLQALFISRRTYPIAYDKWIRDQIVDVLGLPGLYGRLPGLFEIERFESKEIAAKARDLRGLFDAYVGEASSDG